MFSVSKIGFDCSGVLNWDGVAVYSALKSMADQYSLGPMPPFEKWMSFASNCVQTMKSLGMIAPDHIIYSDFQHHYQRGLDRGIRGEMYPDVVQTLEALKEKGKTLYVVSSHPKALLDQEIKDLYHYFEEVTGGCMDKASKLKELAGDNPSDFAYIGDMTFDLLAARKAGVVALAVTTGYCTREQLENVPHDKIFNNLSELTAFV